MAIALAFSTLCVAAVAGLLVAEKLGKPVMRAACKLGASSSFVLVALLLGGHETLYGRLILGALALGWLGDALLLSNRIRLFLAGLTAFLLSHLCFTLAFVTGAFSMPALALGVVAGVGVGVAVVRRLWPHLSNAYKLPVLAYVAAILAMCAAALGFAAASSRWQPLLGALIFMASDLFVARDRFIVKDFTNKAWGLPTYYTAQLLLAWSVTSST